jgi:hypothetical protein
LADHIARRLEYCFSFAAAFIASLHLSSPHPTFPSFCLMKYFFIFPTTQHLYVPGKPRVLSMFILAHLLLSFVFCAQFYV